MFNLPKWVRKLIGVLHVLFFSVMSIHFFNEAEQSRKQHYEAQQTLAAHLLSLNCENHFCLREGQIEYLKSVKTGARGPFPTPRIYFYRYTFTVAGKTYARDEFRVFGENTSFLSDGFRYQPRARITKGKTFPEPILFDPRNPEINLPLHYAKVLSEIPNPYVEEKKTAILFFVFGLFIGGVWFFDD